MNTSQDSYDYLVIGGGSAGCIVASRLAREQTGSVLLLEAGDPAAQHPETLSADGFKYAFANDALMSHRMTLPQQNCGNRKLYAGTGRGIGGSGAVNGMVYTRGDAADFQAWPKGWSWAEVQPAFAAVERHLGIQTRVPTPFAARFLDAAIAAGFARKDGLNDGALGGFFGCNDMNYAGDERRSSYRALLHEQALPNLRIVTQARARRLIIAADKTVTAVECEIAGQIVQIGVRREVLLCAGALETPKLLLLSGCGPRAELEQLGIEVVVDAAGVGRNLQDHPNVCAFFRSEALVDFQYPQIYGFDAARETAGSATAPDTCYVCYAAPASIEQSMLRMLPILALPGRLYEWTWLRKALRRLITLAFRLPPLQKFVSKVFGIVVILGKPRSRGSVRLRSRDPDVAAAIDPAYYRDPHDRQTLLAGLQRARQIVAQTPLADVAVQPLSPGARDVSPAKAWKWAVAATMTTFHYCGSCSMGDQDEQPVDRGLKFKGLRNLRVADASVIPEIPVSALNAPSMMIAWRAADFILAGRQQ